MGKIPPRGFGFVLGWVVVLALGVSALGFAAPASSMASTTASIGEREPSVKYVTTDQVINLCEWEPMSCLGAEEPSLTVHCNGSGVVTVSPPLPSLSGNLCGKSLKSVLEPGTMLLLQAAPSAGWTFAGWSGACSGVGACEVTMSGAKSITATFDLKSEPKFNLTVTKTGAGSGAVVSSPAGIDCGSKCEAGFEEGSTVILTAVADPGSKFRKWNGACVGASATCEVTMSEAKSVTASFSHERPLLTLAKSGAGLVKSKLKAIACGSTCTAAVGQYYKGTPAVLTAKAMTDGALEGWEGCDSSTNTGLEGTCTVAMSEARNVKATFKPAVKPLVNPQTLILSKTGTGFGTVKATGLVCEVACTSTAVAYYGGAIEPKFKAATTVTLIATPSAGSEFAGWTGCESEPEGKCAVLMSEARSVTVQFTAKAAKALTLTKEGYGSVKSKPKGIACGNACSLAVASLPEDTVVLLSAKAGTGSEFTGWEGCVALTQTELESTCEVALASSKAVKAMFSAATKPLVNPQTLILSKTGTGFGTVKATGLVCEVACTSTAVAYYGGAIEPKFKAATTVTLIATPSAGSEFAGWTGCESEPEGKCAVLMSEARSVTARFEE